MRFKEIAINVSNKPHLTPYVFYNYLIPTLHNNFMKNKEIEIKLNFYGVDSISPLVIPGLLSIGATLKKYYGKPIELLLEWRPKLIRFLYGLGFFSLIRDNEIFTYNENFIGGFDPKPMGDFRYLSRFNEEDLNPDEIARLLLLQNEGAILNHFEDIDLARKFARTVGQLMHNCVKHGRSPAYVCAFGGSKIGLQCAVSDAGVGYYESILKHPEDLRLFNIDQIKINDYEKHYRSIVESVYRRVGQTTYGICSVIDDVVSYPGIVRIHSGTTQIVFTSRNYRNFINNDFNEDEMAKSLMKYLDARKHFAQDIQKSPLRIWESQLSGVHIEFEFSNRFELKGREL